MNPTWWDRFWSKIEEVDGHLLWVARTNSNGYGEFWIHGSYEKAHKILWEHNNGPVPSGMEMGHTCEFRNCVLHVRPVTHKKNMEEASLHKSKCKRGHEYNRVDGRGWNKCDQCRSETRRARANG